MIVKVYEDNGGMIHAIVEDRGFPINIISGFEDGLLSKDEFISAAKEGFIYADDYDSDKYSGLRIKKASAEIKELDDLIAEITTDAVTLHPEKMGYSGMCLFEIKDT